MIIDTINEKLIKDLINQYGSPLVIYDEEQLISNYEKLKSAVGKNTIIYSMKANPNPHIIKILSSLGCYVETASEGEYSVLKTLGIPVNNIIYSGQAKSESGISQAINDGVFLINVESKKQMELVIKYSEKHKKETKVLLRINPSSIDNNAVLKMGGTPSPFGVDECYIKEIAKMTKGTCVKLTGLFMYNGSQYYCSSSIYNNTKYLCNLANEYKDLMDLEYLDFGGGFGVVESEDQHELDMNDLKIKLTQVDQHLDALDIKKAFFESGRYLTSSCGILVSTVVDTKMSRSKKFVILDSGINNTGIKQYCYRTYEPFLLVVGNKTNKIEHQILVGPTCTTIDRVHRGINLPSINIGDNVIFLESGAYLMSYSPIHFCGHPTPAEIMICKDGQVILTRERTDIKNACGFQYTYPTL